MKNGCPIPPEPVAIDFRTVELVRRVFLPRNPNRMRGANPEVIQAARDFIAAYENAKAKRQSL